MNNYKVYRHISPSGKVYIGITKCELEKRWKNGKGYEYNSIFSNAIKKYGWNNFKHEVLFSELNEVSAKLIECDLIYYYKQLNISYNITDGGDGSAGLIMSEESRKKMSAAKKGKPSVRRGCHLSEETKEKLRQANLGKHISEEAKEKIRSKNKEKTPWNKGIKGMHLSEEAKEKIRQANTGRHPTEETRIKLSEARKNRIITEETRLKLSEACKGKHWKIDPETGKRIYYKN